MLSEFELFPLVGFGCLFLFFAIVILWHYMISHFEPAIFLSLFFWHCTFAILSFIFQEILALGISIFLTQIFMIGAINMFFMYTFSFKGSFFNITNFFHFALTMFFMGFRTTEIIYSTESQSNQYPLFNLHIGLYFLFSFIPITIQIYGYFRLIPASDPRKKGYFMGIIFGVLDSVGLTLTYLTINIWWFFVPLCSTLCFIGFVYIKNPHLLFLSPAGIDQIIFLDGISGSNLLKIGAEELTSEILFSSFLLQKDLSGAKVLPVELTFHDKCILIEHKIELDHRNSRQYILIAMIIADSPVNSFRRSLQYAVERFVSQYWANFKENPNFVSKFTPFLVELIQIFGYSLKSQTIRVQSPQISPIVTTFRTNRELIIISVIGLVTLLSSILVYLWGLTNSEATTFFYLLYSNVIITTWAMLAGIYSFKALSYQGVELQKKWIWISIGLAFWAVASIIWAYYQLFEDVELPYPSLADVFWLVGYIPLLIGTSLYSFSIKKRLSPAALIRLALYSSIGFFLTFIFLLLPIAITPVDEDFTLIQKYVSLLYPILDLILIPLIIGLYLKKKGEIRSHVWLFLTIGMGFIIVLDVFFAYMDWNGLISNWSLLDLVEVCANFFLTLGAVYFRVENRNPKAVQSMQ